MASQTQDEFPLNYLFVNGRLQVTKIVACRLEDGRHAWLVHGKLHHASESFGYLILDDDAIKSWGVVVGSIVQFNDSDRIMAVAYFDDSPATVFGGNVQPPEQDTPFQVVEENFLCDPASPRWS